MPTDLTESYFPSEHEQLLRDWLIAIQQHQRKKVFTLVREMAVWRSAAPRSIQEEWRKRFGVKLMAMTLKPLKAFIGSDKTPGKMPRDASQLFLLEEFLKSRTDYAQHQPEGASVKTVAKIIKPRTESVVEQRTTISGQNFSVDPDMTPWLVVQISDSTFYPQTPITRRPQKWNEPVTIGRSAKGLDAGGRYLVLLVLVDEETHYQYSRYIRRQHESQDGMGPTMPKSTKKLDSIWVIRGRI